MKRSKDFYNDAPYYGQQNNNFDDYYQPKNMNYNNGYSNEYGQSNGYNHGWHPQNRNPYQYNSQPPQKSKKKFKEPKDITRSAISSLKLTSQFLYIIGVFSTIIGLVIVFILNKQGSKLFLNRFSLVDYYVGDVSIGLTTFGSIFALVSGIIFGILFIMLFFNRKGWLRKSSAYIPGFLATGLIIIASGYVYLVLQKGISLFESKYGQIFTNSKSKWIISIILALGPKYIPNGLIDISKIGDIFWTRLDTHLWGSIVALIISAIVSSLFIKSLNKTLDNSERFFSSIRSYR